MQPRRSGNGDGKPRRDERVDVRVYEVVSRICPPGFLSIGMYDRQPNWSHSSRTDDRRVPSVSFAILSIVLPLISLEETRTPSHEFGVELHTRGISILSRFSPPRRGR